MDTELLLVADIMETERDQKLSMLEHIHKCEIEAMNTLTEAEGAREEAQVCKELADMLLLEMEQQGVHTLQRVSISIGEIRKVYAHVIFCI